MGGEESRCPSSDGSSFGIEEGRILHLASHDKIQFGFTSGSRSQLWQSPQKEVRHSLGDKGPKQTRHDVLENQMSYLPLVAHFFSPARILAPLPLRSFLFRISSNVSLRFSGGTGLINLSSFGMTISPSSGGKS
jgi:hypothetical protein